MKVKIEFITPEKGKGADSSIKVKNLGFEYATISGVSWGMDDLIVPPQKEEILEKAQKEIEMIESHFKKGLLS